MDPRHATLYSRQSETTLEGNTMTHIAPATSITPPSHLLPLLTAEVISDGDADLLQASGLYEYEPVWIGGRDYVGCLAAAHAQQKGLLPCHETPMPVRQVQPNHLDYQRKQGRRVAGPSSFPPITQKGTPIMSTWKTARADTRLNTSRQNGWLYVQWHHGTDSRKDALPEGGWEIEKAKYPGLQLALPSGRVLHGNAKLLDCWVAENLTVATLATRTTWYLGRTGEAREIPSYAPGAWSRFHVLAYVADIERLAVLTLRAAASQVLGQQLRLYGSSVLTKAQRDAPDLPPSAFWLTSLPRAGREPRRGWERRA